MRNAWATSAHPTLLKNVWMFFQVAFGERRQPESRVRALHTHPTTRATLATIYIYFEIIGSISISPSQVKNVYLPLSIESSQ